MINQEKQVYKRIRKSNIFTFIIYSLSILAILPLFFIIIYILFKGIPHIDINFLTETQVGPGEVGGGILNALIGTLELVLIAGLMSVPISILTGIYVVENIDTKTAKIIMTLTGILQGIPSIVFGIVAYTWVVGPLGSFSLLSGAVALGMMMLPYTISVTVEVLKLVPDILKEAATALGAPYYRVVLKIILPAAFTGIANGVLISIARVMGETAPLLFTAFGNPYLSYSLNEPISSLPLIIYQYGISPYENWQETAWGASVLLVFFVLTINISAKWILRKWKIQF